jgi:hypothetical protein
MMQSVLHLMRVKQRTVAPERLVKLAQVFSPVVRIMGADFALHFRQRMQLGGAAAVSKICGRCHIQLLATNFQLPLVRRRHPLGVHLDFGFTDSLCS